MTSFVENTFLPIVWISLLPFVVAALVGLCVRIIAVWFFRRTDSLIMKERINEGSDRFFEDRRKEERTYIAGGELPQKRIDTPIRSTRIKSRSTGSRR